MWISTKIIWIINARLRWSNIIYCLSAITNNRFPLFLAFKESHYGFKWAAKEIIITYNLFINHFSLFTFHLNVKSILFCWWRIRFFFMKRDNIVYLSGNSKKKLELCNYFIHHQFITDFESSFPLNTTNCKICTELYMSDFDSIKQRGYIKR